MNQIVGKKQIITAQAVNRSTSVKRASMRFYNLRRMSTEDLSAKDEAMKSSEEGQCQPAIRKSEVYEGQQQWKTHWCYLAFRDIGKIRHYPKCR